MKSRGNYEFLLLSILANGCGLDGLLLARNSVNWPMCSKGIKSAFALLVTSSS